MRVAMLSAVIACLLMLLLCDAAPPAGKVRFDFKGPGGAKAALGLARLQNIRRVNEQQDKTLDELAKLLEDQNDLGLDLDEDRLFYACAGMAVDPAVDAAVDPALADVPVAEAATLYAADGTPGHHHHRRQLLQTGLEWESAWLPEQPDIAISQAAAFSLHSRPSAKRKIFLDFDGSTATGTSWNNAYNGGNPMITPPFDTDGNPSNWSPSELAVILAVWRGVSEDFAPFEVDVTTEDPSLTNTPLSDWVRAAIGGRSETYFGGSYGGIAYLNVAFNGNHFYQPAYVFPLNLGNSAKNIWEAVSHEIGHNFNLNHDGRTSPVEEYYRGHNGWAPIMGVGYYQSVTQWSRGEYAFASRSNEDDFAIIASRLAYVPQLQGSSTVDAASVGGALNADGATVTAKITGVIRSPSDSEFMYFQSNASGTATIRLLPTPASGSAGRSNLNMRLTVFDSVGAVIASPPASVGITTPLNVALPSAGKYFISIVGAGAGVDATTGYTTYGSRGLYQLFVTYPSDGNVVQPPTGPPPPPPPPPPSVMTITGWTGVRSTADRQGRVTCTFTFTLIDSVSRAALPSSALVDARFTTSTISTLLDVRPNTQGVVTLTTAKFRAADVPSRTCSVEVTDVSLTGYVLDTAAVRTRTATW